MTGLETILTIILGIGFAVLLILSIVVVFIIIRILQNVQHITKKAEVTTDNLAEVVKSLAKRLAPVAVSSLAGLVMKKLKQRRNNKEDV